MVNGDDDLDVAEFIEIKDFEQAIDDVDENQISENNKMALM